MNALVNGEMRRVCRKCLLRDMPEEEYFRNLHEYIERLDDDVKVPSDIYEERLSKCRECESLLSGMCRICGCYVELRACMRKNSCPAVHPKWDKEPEAEEW
ncbi:MAG: hypothetical protein IJ123_01535 [Blautia sp.]|nr:hypothetical protein [Blautia sp.]